MNRPRNIAGAVRGRLFELSKERGEDFQLILQRYAAERFLYRLGESAHRDRFVLKGAMLFALWGGSIYRATRDLDLAGYGNYDTNALTRCFHEICTLPGADDGIIFLPATMSVEPIRDQNEYGGVRVRLQATLGQARFQLQIDVGFGNAIMPPAEPVAYPTLLKSPGPQIRAYPREAVVAEKFHAMVVLGATNSRMKDFYDLFVLSAQFPFSGNPLTQAIAATFTRRNTSIPTTQPNSLSPVFYFDEPRATQWRSYLERNRLPSAPANFGVVGSALQTFLTPPLESLVEGARFAREWPAGGPWR